MKYEIHVTFDVADGADVCPQSVEEAGAIWHPSTYLNDPTLGEGVRSYLTTYAETIDEAVSLAEAAQRRWPFAVRVKIELEVYDWRRGNYGWTCEEDINLP